MVLITRDPDSPAFWQDDFPVSNRYTYGLAGERFFRGVKNGIIYGTRCQTCNITYVPASAFCERCLSELSEWIDVGIKGVIFASALLYVDIDGIPLSDPEMIAFIRVADGGLIHKLNEIPVDDIQIGSTVEAVFKPETERQGSITDILFFKPVNND